MTVNLNRRPAYRQLRNLRSHALALCVSMLAVTLLAIGPSVHALADSSECLDCHEGEMAVPLNASWHLRRSMAGSGTAAECTDCHGSSSAHREDPFSDKPEVYYRDLSPERADAANGACLSCHADSGRSWWAGSAHQDAELACASCHTVHATEHAIADKAQQVATCGSCHSQVRAAGRLRSHHPVSEGQLSCLDCHNPHGSSSASMLTEPTLNDTCFRCHAEKRGPFLFEHQPATEDCSLCHSPHGSMNDALLAVRPPFLCQQCHSAAFHPSQLQSGGGLPGAGNSEFLLGKSCLNCHAQVHGSNHPSGARMTR